MPIDAKKLEIVSNETISSVQDLNIITPTIYKSHFTKNALMHNTDIDDEEKLTDDVINNNISKLQNMQEETANNVIKLSDNTTRAISAIKDNDSQSLNAVLQETQELRKEIEKLKESVYKDELTHAFNRKWLNDNYIQANEDGDKFKQAGTLAIIDLNYFKLVNDTFGHIVGDKVLVFIANKLKLTKENVVRYGGDEFIVIFSEDISKDSALKKLSKIREGVIAKKLKSNNSEFRVSFSFGAIEFKENDMLNSVIEDADKNMYDDKIQIKKIVTGI
ncbi:GGDEF domain-containing protein [Sulfurimonas sp.]